MSYLSLIKSLVTLRQAVRQPTGIAAIASIGVHGLLFVVLPMLSFASKAKEPEIQRPVSLVELTPEQVSRLPDFSTPQVPIPTAPPSSDLYSLTPLPNPFSPIPFQSFPPSYRGPLPFTLPSFVLPSQSFTTPPPPSRSTTRNPTPTQTPAPRQQTTLTPNLALPSPGFSGRTVEVPDLQALGSGTTPNPTSTLTPQPQPQPSAQATDRLIAEQQQLREQFTYRGDGTSNDEATQTYTPWLREITTLLGSGWNGQNPERVDILAPYPRAACFGRLQGITVIGALVDAEGKALDNPELALIQSSGYPFFNRRAMEIVKDYKFNQAEGRKPYLVYVKFEPNNQVCPGALPSASPPPS